MSEYSLAAEYGSGRLNYVARGCDAGRRIKHVLRGELMLSSSLVARIKLLPDGILLNGERAFTSAVLSPGDILSVRITDEPSNARIRAVEHPLDIVYEDECILVIDKPAGMAVHPGALAQDSCTVANVLAYRLGEAFTFHPVNRLDRGTTGLMVVAKSAYIHERLKRTLHAAGENAFYREYRAVVTGVPQPGSGTVELPIGRAGDSAIKRCIDKDGDSAITFYEVLSQRNGLALVRLLPFTGRTHQLRVHMAALGHPLAGDWLYGVEDRSLISRPALHSYKLRLTHPITGEPLELISPLPEDMLRLI